MGKILIILLALPLYVQASITVVSDLDDTLKRTNVDSSGRAIYNGVFTRYVFSNMPQLFKEMKSYTDGLYILTSSPSAIRFNIFRLLNDYQLETEEVITRRLAVDRDKFKYKYNAVKSIIQKTGNQVILLGDDVGEDPEIYAALKRDFPESVIQVYIHKIKNREVPAEVTTYISAFDVAAHEYLAGRMNFSEVSLIGDNIATEENFFRVIPYYMNCPKEDSYWDQFKAPELMSLVDDISERIVEYCSRPACKLD